jgi:DNA-binding winged helix-turn-helix (wHTH) protein
MDTPASHVYRFNGFQFDADRLVLYHDGELVKETEKKSLEVLAALVESPGEPVSHDEKISRVWKDNPHGATPARVNQYVSRIRKALAQYEPEKKFIESLKGRGYVFCGEMDTSGDSSATGENVVEIPLAPGERAGIGSSATQRAEGRLRPHYAFAGLAVLIVVLAAVWKYYPQSDIEDVKKVVKESQFFESLVLYKNPSGFSEDDLDKYWTTELDIKTNYDRGRIRDSVQKLVAEGKRYGEETRCEQLEFQSVEINQNGDMAVVKTLEKWFVAVYQNDGTLLKNKYVGPYFVSYVLRKIDGKWLVEKSTTARVNRPTPHVDDIEPASEVKAGQQFLVNISGQDFEPETVYIEVVGPGCPESKPCKVPNSALRENSKLSTNTIERVPLTLASGDFKIALHNADSPSSEQLRLVVP